MDLSRQKFPPAMHLVGIWELTGEHVTQDAADGLALIQKAAAKNYGPAMYEIAIRQIEGRDMPKDFEHSLETMRQASVLGSPQAQFYLGNRYESGNALPGALRLVLGVEADPAVPRRATRRSGGEIPFPLSLSAGQMPSADGSVRPNPA
jgi:TPR repeat protein